MKRARSRRYAAPSRPLEAANGGTIFLDEVGDLPPDIQIALLRVLQERKIERVGGDRPVPVDVVCCRDAPDLDRLVTKANFARSLLRG